MIAVRIHNYGGPEELRIEDAPVPEIAADEVRIKVMAAGVNPVDWKIREGLRKTIFPSDLPLTLGWDVSGLIDHIGENVTGFVKGDEVFAMCDLTRNGSFAEYVTVRATSVARKPKSINHEIAASVPLAALTAWQSLFDAGKLHEGQKILILGASGGVGSFAVQFAKWKKAYIIGVCSTKNLDFLRVIGANEVIDYTTTAFNEIVHDADIVFDTVGGSVKEQAWKCLKDGGTIVSIVRSATEDIIPHGKHGILVSVKPDAERLSTIAGLIDLGVVKPVVSAIYPLHDAAKAQETLKNGSNLRGKIVLRVATGF